MIFLEDHVYILLAFRLAEHQLMEDILIETQRLLIRAFRPEDLTTIHRILEQTFGDGTKLKDEAALHERAEWLAWSRLNHSWFPRMGQAPYGDRAIVLKSSGALIGSVGYVPLLGPFEQIPGIGLAPKLSKTMTPAFGLFWVIDPQVQRQGYATEAGGALVAYAFQTLHLQQIIATTEYDNIASQTVMRKIGMRLERNPFPEPHWLQVVGIMDNPNI